MMQARAQTQATTFTNTGDVNSNGCSFMCISQPLILLFITLIITTTATAMLSAAIMTDHWEHINWDSERLNKMINNVTQTIRWIPPRGRIIEIISHHHKPIFLIPLYGGIWTLCMDVTHKEIRLLRERARYRHGLCSSYLNISIERSRREEMRGDWSHGDAQASIQPHMRMQNLSISCSLVCLIILGSAALVGAFGICQKQISAILITGIMYLLAALFALFTLTIIHYKRQHGRPIVESDFDDNMVDGIVTLPGAMRHAHRLLSARIIAFSWSLQLGWGGVLLCTLTSGLWILLSKVLRYNPISAFAI